MVKELVVELTADEIQVDKIGVSQFYWYEF